MANVIDKFKITVPDSFGKCEFFPHCVWKHKEHTRQLSTEDILEREENSFLSKVSVRFCQVPP